MGLTVQLHNRAQVIDSAWDDNDPKNGSIRGLEDIGVKGFSTLKKMQLRRKHTLAVLEAQQQARGAIQSKDQLAPSTATDSNCSVPESEIPMDSRISVVAKAEHDISEASRKSSKASIQPARELAKKDASERDLGKPPPTGRFKFLKK
jgi:hypothetical protein